MIIQRPGRFGTFKAPKPKGLQLYSTSLDESTHMPVPVETPSFIRPPRMIFEEHKIPQILREDKDTNTE